MILSQVKCNKLKLLILYRRWKFLKSYYKDNKQKEKLIHGLVITLKDELTVFHAFDWHNTLEGQAFWAGVDKGTITRINNLRLK